MRILWHSIGPWHKTGYGRQTAVFAPRIRDLGHEVVIAIMGERGERASLNHPDAAVTKVTGLWEGMRVIGPGLTEFALPAPDAILGAFGGSLPDLCIILKDAWVLEPDAYRRFPRTILWLAGDCETSGRQIGRPDQEFFTDAPQVLPVAVSRWGQSTARKTGLGARYIPHGIDTGFWSPGDQKVSRSLSGLPAGTFVAGIDATNNENGIGPRKGFGEQFAAFAQFHARHPDSLLAVNSAPEKTDGVNLRLLAADLGISDAVRFGANANMDEGQMLNFYRCLDVLMQGTLGEGFGLPVVQAHAVGVPVIGTRCSAISEKIPPGTGYLVGGQKVWHTHHCAWWLIPSISGLAAALGKARRQKWAVPLIREHAMQYDADRIAKDMWGPLIEEVCNG